MKLGRTLAKAAAVILLPLLISACGSAGARSRASQKRSAGEVRSLATAILSYSVDWKKYPDTGGKAIPAQDIDRIPEPGLQSRIVPDYLMEYQPVDGWGKNPYYYASNGDHFVIYSLGSDGLAGRELEELVKRLLAGEKVDYAATHCYQDDIVWGDEQFARAPEGKQKKC